MNVSLRPAQVRRGVFAVGVLLAACSADTTGPIGGEPEGLSFSYRGAASGLHTSKGVAQLGTNGLPTLGTWAVARPDSLGGLVIAGFEKTNGDSGNLFILQLPTAQTKEYQCTLFGIDGGCHGRIFFGVNPNDATVAGGVYVVSAGTARLTEIGVDRVRGTFTLTLQKSDDPQQTLIIEEGAIDVAFSNDVTLANGIACLARNLADGKNQVCQ